MNVELLAPGDELVTALADRAAGTGGGAMDDVLVLLPGKRIGHFLRRELSRRIGAAFAPPTILTLGDLVDGLFDRWHPEGLPMARRIDAVALLHDVQREAQRPLGGDGFMSLDAFLPLGFRIFEAVEELHADGIDAADVGGVQVLIEDGVPPAARERLATLRIFYERLYPRWRRPGFHALVAHPGGPGVSRGLAPWRSIVAAVRRPESRAPDPRDDRDAARGHRAAARGPCFPRCSKRSARWGCHTWRRARPAGTPPSPDRCFHRPDARPVFLPPAAAPPGGRGAAPATLFRS
jgi:hypothetical protein